MDPMLMNPTERTETSLPWERAGETLPRRRSRAAEYIAALYVALVLCTPWLVRDSLTLTPPSSGIETQLVSKTFAAPPSDASARTGAAASTDAASVR